MFFYHNISVGRK